MQTLFNKILKLIKRTIKINRKNPKNFKNIKNRKNPKNPKNLKNLKKIRNYNSPHKNKIKLNNNSKKSISPYRRCCNSWQIYGNKKSK